MPCTVDVDQVSEEGLTMSDKTKMQIEYWDIDRLIPYARNPRKNDDAVPKMAGVIKEFGFKVPIVAKSDGEVIDGHLRLKAARQLGMTEVPVVLADEWTPAQVKAFRLAVNRSAEWAEWDDELLKLELDDLKLDGFDLELIDFGDLELDAGGTEGLADPDEVPEAPEQPVSRQGDIWLLGKHRLMCGDSTDAGSVTLLMDGKKADITFSSPPYNMQASNISKAFQSAKVKDTYGIKDGTYKKFNDALSDEEYSSLLNKALDCSISFSDEVFFNIGILAGSKCGIIDMFTNHKEQFLDVLVWNKDACMPLCLPSQKHLVNHICELIFCFSSSGTRAFSHSQWELGKMNNRIDVGKQSNNEFSKIHHATFPVELPMYVIKWFSEKSVYDCFGGTGSTLIAAEKLGRQCFMMELDPLYVDVIIRRWQDFTGNEATLEADGRTFAEVAQERGPSHGK